MTISVRGAARVVFSPMSHFRSIKERVGIIGFAFAVLFVMSQSLLAHGFKVGDIELVHPWSREMPGGARVAAGYVRIVNHGSEADRLVAATSTLAGRTEIHEMAVDANGIMTMRPIEGLEVPAGGEIELTPGGYHIMFLDPAHTKKKGDSFAGSLTFEKAGTIKFEFSVDAMGGGSGHGSSHGSGHGGHENHGASGHGHHGGAHGSDDAGAIRHVLMEMFDRPEERLTVEAVTIEGNIAVAGWAQGEMGGRALMRRHGDAWRIILCSGDALKEAAALQQFGLTAEQADTMAASVVAAEAQLYPALVEKFSRFDGVAMMDADGSHPPVIQHGAEGGHGAHKTH